MSLRLTETVTMPGKPALLSKQELRQGFDASHPQMAGGANVESLLRDDAQTGKPTARTDSRPLRFALVCGPDLASNLCHGVVVQLSGTVQSRQFSYRNRTICDQEHSAGVAGAEKF